MSESLISYEDYHKRSLEIGDIDPSYEMLRYLCARYELNIEQRYWLAFLYATCYCGPTVFYIYNEFPDYENVDIGRLSRWWEANKQKCVFQTDRLRVKTGNHFVPMFQSYQKILGGVKQRKFFEMMKSPDLALNYKLLYKEASKIFQMGRFSLFLYLEAIHVVTDFPMMPGTMDMREAESCRNGLAYAIEREDLVNHFDDRNLSKEEMAFLQSEFDKLIATMRARDQRNNLWNIETTLCAYKKYRIGKRYIGYYLDRQFSEIQKMQANVSDGVDWSVLWQYREETYNKQFLKEFK